MSLSSFLVMAAALQGSLCDRLAATVRHESAAPAAFQQARKTKDGLLTPALGHAETVTVSPAFAKQLAATYPDHGDEGAVSVERAGPIWQATWVSGTLHCADDVFFTRRSDGAIVKQPRPAAYSDLCWTSARDLGTLFGQTALIERDGGDTPYPGEKVVVTPWRSGWEPPCGVAIQYQDRFDLTERFCSDDAICVAGAALAPRLATALGRGDDDKKLQALAAAPPATLAANAAALALASKTISDLGDESALPTFGAKAKTEFPDYSDGSMRIMVVVNGTPLLARVGVGGVGWRAIGDYFVALYRIGAGRPVPVASYVVARRTTGLRSVSIYRPKPYHDDR